MNDNKELIRKEIEKLKKWSEFSKKEWIDEGYNQNAFAEDCRIKSFDKLLAFIDNLPDEPGRMKPIYDNKDNFESALAKAWDEYHNGYERVDSFEDDYVECAHAKGFREGYLFGITQNLDETSKNIFRNGVTVGSEITRREESKYDKQLREYFENTPKEQLDKDFEEIKKFNSNRMAIDEIDEYITRHTQNAYEMPDSHPLKGYCNGIDDTLLDILNILNKYYNE